MSLRSICFEDLLQPADSPHRRIVQSSGQGGSNPWMPSLALSRSCPDMLGHVPVQLVHGSLPDHLEAGTIFGAGWGGKKIFIFLNNPKCSSNLTKKNKTTFMCL